MSDSEPAFHTLSAEEALVRTGSGRAGLTTSEAARRLSEIGPNALPAHRRKPFILRLLRHFHNVLIYVLTAAAIVTAALGHLSDAAVITLVVIANGIIGFVQEGRAEKAMASIRRMLMPHAAALRDGHRCTIDSSELVPGDIVLLEAGDRVPADIRLIEAYSLRAEEAVLTGESVPVEKDTERTTSEAPLGDRTGMVFAGTLITRGQATGVVTATGPATEIGQISGLLRDVEELTTPLVRQMNQFSLWLTLLTLIVSALLLVYGVFVQGRSFIEMFMAVVSIAVAAIPEGLPAILTITMAVGVQAMARRNAIVRRLPAIETLGSVSVICTDKTGTLTRNEMVVRSLIVSGEDYSVSGEGYAPEGRVEGPPSPVLDSLAACARLCNDAKLVKDNDVWRVSGDPMEGALLALAAKISPPEDDIPPRDDVIPFDARHRFMATRVGRKVWIKGAPEAVLALCQSTLFKDGAQPIDKAQVTLDAERLASQGQRVLALATLDLDREVAPLSREDIDGQASLIGLVGLIDPPRAEAIDAVAECRSAGIAVKMITGDHGVTAQAIGRMIGLERTERVYTGRDFDGMNDVELAQAALDTDIFARTSPEHKLRLVKALQGQGMVVAMTGDGVNDAPALKRADAGVAMGLKGSDAAKEAAPIVLADDNFASIAAAVREGRTVYDNIRKVIAWLLPTDAGEVMVISVALLFGMTLPVTPLQILWINLVTAVTLGIALAFEPTEHGTMERPPRPPNQPILDGRLVWHVAFVSLLFLAGIFGVYAYAEGQGYSLELSRTIALNTLLVFEIFHLFFVRNIYGTSLTWEAVKGTRVVWISVILTVLAQLAVTYVPVLQSVFGTQAVPLRDGAIIIGLGVAFFALVETEKQIRLSMLAPARSESAPQAS